MSDKKNIKKSPPKKKAPVKAAVKEKDKEKDPVVKEKDPVVTEEVKDVKQEITEVETVISVRILPIPEATNFKASNTPLETKSEDAEFIRRRVLGFI